MGNQPKNKKPKVEDRQEINLKHLNRYNRWYWLIRSWDLFALCLSWLLLIPLFARLEEKAEQNYYKERENETKTKGRKGK